MSDERAKREDNPAKRITKGNDEILYENIYPKKKA